jgi:hypothetical protein
MKRQKASDATMSWFESMRGSQLNDNDLQIDRRIDDFRTRHFPAAFFAHPLFHAGTASTWNLLVDAEGPQFGNGSSKSGR